MKTTKSQFREFKEEVERCITVFSLDAWSVRFRHTDIKEYSKIEYENYMATFFFPTQVKEPEHFDVIALAKHEVCHLLLWELATLALKRFCNKEEVDRAEEGIACRMEKILVELA